jgi:trimeric autotransporter adhesin
MKKTFLLLGIFLPAILHSQTITTISGNGTAGFSGDNGVATDAAMNWPIGGSIDSHGNIYIADLHNNRIRKISASGIITTIAGNGAPGYSGDGGPATAAELNDPYGAAVDGGGNIYIADMQNQRIRKIDPSGTITTVVGDGVAGFSGDGGPASAARIWNPTSVRVGPHETLYFADNQNQRIRKIDSMGTISTIAGNGTIGLSGDGGPATASSMSYPGNMWCDATGNVYTNDGNRIRKISSAGYISTIAGSSIADYTGDGGPATAATLNSPSDVVGDNAGNIYICDALNNCVRKINSGGIISTITGNGVGGFGGDNGPATAAELFGPDGVFFDMEGNLIIADGENDRVRKIEYSSLLVNTVAHAEEISIYPNPAIDRLFIKGERITKVVIINSIGQEVYECTPDAKLHEVVISNLARGLYFVRLNNAEVRKFVAQ